MRVRITEDRLYELFENDDVEGVIKLFDALGLDGENDYYYDSTRESLLRYILNIAIAHDSANHLSNYMLLQLIDRVSMCCGIFQLARLIRIAANIRPRNVTEMPEDIRCLLMLDEYTDDNLREAHDRLKGLNEQETRTLIFHLAQFSHDLSLAPTLNARILRRVHTYRLVPTSALLSFMAASLIEVKAKRSLRQKIADKMAVHVNL